ncbi:Carnitine O-acetyltransferase mitochondrial [Boothiomyces sp. JEL0866]|nr:Carnitine O-acetyltransferase mitochondrial [Boothiomyces sp. JEL0866]
MTDKNEFTPELIKAIDSVIKMQKLKEPQDKLCFMLLGKNKEPQPKLICFRKQKNTLQMTSSINHSEFDEIIEHTSRIKWSNVDAPPLIKKKLFDVLINNEETTIFEKMNSIYAPHISLWKRYMESWKNGKSIAVIKKYSTTIISGYPITLVESILFKHQSSLPKLPVPTLDHTLALYLETIKPLATPAEYKQTEKNVEEFRKNMGPILQQRLIERDNSTDKSWLIEWWNDYAYMGYRDPVVINVNYFFAFSDDKKRTEPAARAASIILGALQFRDLVVSGELEPEATKQGPLCSEQYKYLFNSTRIPKIPSDITRGSDPNTNHHIVVLRKNQFYRVDLVQNGKRLNYAEVKSQLEYIYRSAVDEEASVGVLTTENRDVWTRARNELLALSDKNKHSLDAIETAAFVVCLDDTNPVTKSEHSRAAWHGDGRNRFFDKSMQFIIHDNGKAGFNGEHSMMEATITHRACDYILQNLNDGKIQLGPDTISTSLSLPKKLNFDLNPSIYRYIQNAGKQFDAVVEKHDLEVVTFQGYGKNLIKKLGVSPDAYAQMAIQLAYYKMYGVSRATYESAGTRKYKHGRTETGRSVSVESVKWVQAMQNPHLSKKEQGLLGRQAIKAQSGYMQKAGDGHGVDRHFLGLRLLLKPNEEKPAIFTDPVFARSCHWNLSTSQVTSEFYDGYGWGEVVPDGYGIAYMVKNNSLQFNLASMRLNNRHLDTYFHEALNEMRQVFEASLPEPKAKL